MRLLSAIIPTRDRTQLLKDCVESLVRQRPFDGRLEILVVDDGSEVDPAPELEEFAKGRTSVRVEHQKPSGLNAARNRGVEIARGELLAFLDDDTLVAPEWAAAVIEAFERFRCDGLAGRIQLQMDGPRPQWMTKKLHMFLSEFDLGPKMQWLEGGLAPYGANCAVTRSTFEAVGGFRQGLDRVGGSLLSGGDVEFFLRVKAGGGRILYYPQASVLHRVPPERLNPEWFRRRGFAQGVTDVVLEGSKTRAQVLRALGREALRLGRAAPMLVRNLLAGRGVVSARVWLAYCRGRISAIRQNRR